MPTELILGQKPIMSIEQSVTSLTALPWQEDMSQEDFLATSIQQLEQRPADVELSDSMLCLLINIIVKSVVRKQKMKTENRKQRIRRFNGSLETRTVRGREREYEREKNRKNSITKNSSIYNNLLALCVCVQCTLLYKSLQGLTEVPSYFNALKERLHKLPKYIPNGISFFASFASFGSLCRTCVSDRSQPIRYSVLGLTDRSLPTRYSASSADSADVELVSQHSPSSST